ncbi:MAG: DUF4054 domain-containing protein [Elusimicrobiota bacterium]|jgi:hypothetical protein|nr:DUF4054 domain-containing protein [Elusimicrobiota bacterium]
MTNQIIVDPEKFRKYFNEFVNASDDQIEFASLGASSFISTTKGSINLLEKLQERGVYLATAHILSIQLDPTKAKGFIGSAREGKDSVSYIPPQFKNNLEYYLSLTPYGLELLSILSQIQPLTPKKPANIYPYYNAIRR